MGINLFASSSSFDDSNTPVVPNPRNYRIITSISNAKYLLIAIEYPDCINYEGKKILVFEGIGLTDLLKQKYIDPHFSDNKQYHSPIARFEPTEKGWDYATRFILEIL